MANANAQKFRIREKAVILLIGAPEGIENSWGLLPPGVRFGKRLKDPDQVHWFVKTRADMEKDLTRVLSMVQGETVCWVFYPKASSGMQTDLTRDKGWEELLKHDRQWINLLSFDDTWSAFGMREKTGADRKKAAAPKSRPVFDYVDPQTKTVRLPADFAVALNKSKNESAFFNALSFTNKKEYIEWIVSAKKKDTRQTRIRESIERLSMQWKNPANR